MQETKEQSFEKIMEYENKIHEKNQQRIKIGIRLVIIIPLIFLTVMFKLDSSKVVFLVLWIVSLFAISLYLIVVEYMDYQMQKKLKELGFKDEDADIKGLIDDNLVVEKVIESTGLLEDKQAQKIIQVPALEAHSTDDAIEVHDTDEMTQAEEELVESIRKYAATLGRQAASTPVIDEVQRKEAQDYAAMRKARAAAKRPRTQDEARD